MPAIGCEWYGDTNRPAYQFWGVVENGTGSTVYLRCPLLRDDVTGEGGDGNPEQVRVEVFDGGTSAVTCRLALMDGDSSNTLYGSSVSSTGNIAAETLTLGLPSNTYGEGVYSISCTVPHLSYTHMIGNYAWTE